MYTCLSIHLEMGFVWVTVLYHLACLKPAHVERPFSTQDGSLSSKQWNITTDRRDFQSITRLGTCNAPEYSTGLAKLWPRTGWKMDNEAEHYFLSPSILAQEDLLVLLRVESEIIWQSSTPVTDLEPQNFFNFTPFSQSSLPDTSFCAGI